MRNVDISKKEIVEDENLVKQNNSFFDRFGKFKDAVTDYLIAKKYFPFSLSDSLQSTLQDCLDRCRKIFQMKLVGNDYVIIVTKMSRFCNGIKEEWETAMQNLGSEIVEKLNIMRVVSGNQRDISKLIVELTRIRTWPVTEVICQNYQNKKKEAEDLLSRMHFDEKVESFLNKVSNHQATLADLDDHILEWIKEEGLQGNIQLSIRNANIV